MTDTSRPCRIIVLSVKLPEVLAKGQSELIAPAPMIGDFCLYIRPLGAAAAGCEYLRIHPAGAPRRHDEMTGTMRRVVVTCFEVNGLTNCSNITRAPEIA